MRPESHQQEKNVSELLAKLRYELAVEMSMLAVDREINQMDQLDAASPKPHSIFDDESFQKSPVNHVKKASLLASSMCEAMGFLPTRTVSRMFDANSVVVKEPRRFLVRDGGSTDRVEVLEITDLQAQEVKHQRALVHAPLSAEIAQEIIKEEAHKRSVIVNNGLSFFSDISGKLKQQQGGIVRSERPSFW